MVSLEHLHIFMEQLPAVAWSVDKDMNITSCSGGAIRKLNIEPAQALGMSLYEFVGTSDENEPAINAHLRALKGESVTYEEILSGRTYQAYVEPLRGPGDGITGVMGLALDITDRVIAEKALHETSTLLMHAQKMEAVGRLAGSISHDFNNVLTVIRTYCDMVMEETPKDDSRYEDILEIGKACDLGVALTGQLLEFSRKQNHDPQLVNLSKCLDDISNMLKRLIKPSMELVIRTSSNLPMVLVDTSSIDQVLINLVVNASDAMSDGGTVTITTASVNLSGEKLAKHQYNGPPGRFAMIMVTDTGAGIPAEIQARVFEPFFTTKAKGKGTGLGLATVYNIVEQSHGFMEMESEPGQGTTFRIYLPEAHQP